MSVSSIKIIHSLYWVCAHNYVSPSSSWVQNDMQSLVSHQRNDFMNIKYSFSSEQGWNCCRRVPPRMSGRTPKVPSGCWKEINRQVWFNNNKYDSGGSRPSSRRGRFFWEGEFQGWFLGHELWCLFVSSAPLRSNGVWLLFPFCLILYSPFRFRNYTWPIFATFSWNIYPGVGFNITHDWIIR